MAPFAHLGLLFDRGTGFGRTVRHGGGRDACRANGAGSHNSVGQIWFAGEALDADPVALRDILILQRGLVTLIIF